MSPRKRPPTFTQRHAESISKLKLVLIVVCLVAIPLSFWLNQEDVGSVNSRVTKIESPCKRFGPESKVCQEAFETAVKSITHRIACYIDHESGRPFKPSCIGVHLRIEAPVPKLGAGTAEKSRGAANGSPQGGDASTPSKGHSPSGPSQGGPTDSPSHPHAPSVPDQSSGGGGEVSAPAASPTSPPAVTERITEVVREAGPPSGPPAETAAAPVREVVGGVVEALKPTVEETGHTVTGTGETVTGTTCELAKLLCP